MGRSALIGGRRRMIQCPFCCHERRSCCVIEDMREDGEFVCFRCGKRGEIPELPPDWFNDATEIHVQTDQATYRFWRDQQVGGA